MEFTNAKVAKILRGVAATYAIKNIGNIFQIRAYENAASSIEHLTAEISDFWQENKLKDVPGLGSSIQGYLNELFTLGKVKHFEEIQKGVPEVFFDLLEIPGIGPKTAQKIASLGVKNTEDLKKKIKSGELVEKGFSPKIAQGILVSLQGLNQEKKRMLLPYAAAQAERILSYLKKNPKVLAAHPLGSLRRKVATVGDLDFSVSSNELDGVVEYFCQMRDVARVIEKGVNQQKVGVVGSKATVVLKTGIQADLLVGKPESYGALLQHFTGSKAHNIKLRGLANKKGYSLSEYGVKSLKGGKLVKTETEEEFYKLLGMQAPSPEIREDTGEIEAAKVNKLPVLVELQDIKGDFHVHSSYPFKSPSHGPGADSIEIMIRKAIGLRYQFIGISDHPPGFSRLSKEEIIREIEKRTKFIQSLNQRTKSIRVLNGLEIDILGDGSLSVPEKALVTLDYCIAGIHSGHKGPKEIITKRIIAALENPHVDIISHPTNRLLNERESSDADWELIFKVAAKNNKILEINGYPNRLDLRDDLVREALKSGVKFVINTDSHQVSQMDNMQFGISVARRGWVTKESVVNTWDWKRLTEWFNIRL